MSMEPKLSDQQLRLLAEGINNSGRLQASFADRLYSSGDAARSALMTLESWGFIVADKETLGCFIIIKAPDEAFRMAETMKDAKKKAEQVLANTQKQRMLDEI